MSPKQKIAPNCSFFAIRDRREFPRSQIKAQKTQQNGYIAALFRFAGAKGSPQSQKSCKKLVIFVFAIG